MQPVQLENSLDVVMDAERQFTQGKFDDAKRTIAEGLQRFPGSSQLQLAEAAMNEYLSKNYSMVDDLMGPTSRQTKSVMVIGAIYVSMLGVLYQCLSAPRLGETKELPYGLVLFLLAFACLLAFEFARAVIKCRRENRSGPRLLNAGFSKIQA